MSTQQLRDQVAATGKAKHPYRTLYQKHQQEQHDLRMGQIRERELLKRQQANDKEDLSVNQASARQVLRYKNNLAKEEMTARHRQERASA